MHVVLNTYSQMKIISQVMQRPASKLCLFAVMTLMMGYAESVCERGKTWWDRHRSSCMPCTRCDVSLRQAVRVPCEIHRDTICTSLYELNIWPFTNNHSYKSYPAEVNYDQVDYEDYEVVESEAVTWTAQTLTLIVAASGCVVFFVVVLFLTLYHGKQWRKFKLALQSDVEDLSAKLKLMESGREPATEHVPSTDHHIYCNIHIGKDAFLASAGKPGNVYTEEKSRFELE